MESLIQALEQLTAEVVRGLSTATFESLEQFVTDREAIIVRIKLQGDSALQPYRERIQKLLDYDPLIVNRMSELKVEAGGKLSRIDQTRKQKSAYDHAYSADSYFFDRKK